VRKGHEWVGTGRTRRREAAKGESRRWVPLPRAPARLPAARGKPHSEDLSPCAKNSVPFSELRRYGMETRHG
jgi:hypothetical protein